MNENEIENELKHWGILGMHWGIRRFQNPDGSLTPEGRERYLKKVDDAIKNENKSYKVTSKAIDEFNKKLPELNAYLEKQGWLGDDWQAHEKESNEYLAKEWKKIFKELANKEYGEIANKVYDNEEEWMSRFLYYHLYTDEFTNRQLYASDDFDENILKHWGILGMKWGIRNYQNPDGSLTPLGRIRYGVGAKKDVTGNVMGINDAGSLSDEELKRMTRRYQNQADYYNARNNFIYQEARFKENTAPKQKERKPSAIGRFVSNVFGRPFENFMAQNVTFALGGLGYSILESEHPEMAVQYLNSLTGSNIKYKNKIEKDTEETERLNKNYEEKNKLRKSKYEYEHPDEKKNEDIIKELKDENATYRLLNQLYENRNKYDERIRRDESSVRADDLELISKLLDKKVIDLDAMEDLIEEELPKDLR